MDSTKLVKRNDNEKVSSEVKQRGNEEESSSDESSSHSGFEEQSTTSKTDSNDTESIAVDCHTGPAEVIVKGKNVRKIKVKFPQPALDDVNFKPRKPPSGSKLRSQGTLKHRSSGQIPQEHGDDYEYNPLSQDEQALKPLHHSSTYPSALPDIARTNSFASSYYSNSSSREDGISAVSLDLGLQYGAYDLDSKIKTDIINGIEYFERKNAEMREINNKVLRELERVTRLNNQLEDSLKLAKERHKLLSCENDELKIKVDQKEKEVDKFKNESMSQWTTRIKTEEIYMELKRTSELEIKTLKEQLESKEKEVVKLLASVKEKTGPKKSHADGHFNKGLKTHMDDHLELLHKISRLEEELQKIKSERDRFVDSNRKGKDEVDGMKSKLREHTSELETQHKRFLTLKKSFNDLLDENDKLKLQLHVRGGKKNPTAININNNTWPKNVTAEKLPEQTDTVSLVGLSSKLGKAQGSKKVGKATFEHKRAPSDGRTTSESLLPPVPSPVK